MANNNDHNNLNIDFSYPYDPNFEYETYLERINLDDECVYDIRTDNGFRIIQGNKIKKNIKSTTGIFSPKFGQQLTDMNPFVERYKCDCGYTMGRINNGMKCEICGSEVKFVDDNFGYTGWIMLKDEYCIIHPNLYKSINAFLGSERKVPRLDSILAIQSEKDEDGFDKPREFTKEDPYYGIGMTEFREKFDEIMVFYYNKSTAKKKEYFEDIMKNRDKIFIHSIPVYTTLLRPFKQDGLTFTYNDVSGIYNMMARLANDINKDTIRIFKKKKPKEILLYDLQNKYMALYDELEKLIAGKKGTIRQLFGGRFTFTARAVIIGNPYLRSDQIKLSYYVLCEACQYQIVNILQKSYSMSYDEAYRYWKKASFTPDKIVRNIIESLIKSSPSGLPFIVNRPPTIAYGSILQMYCVEIDDSFTMSIPLNATGLLKADFDGDTLTILSIINNDFLDSCVRILNPRNAFNISKNDGLCNQEVVCQRDYIINTNTLLYLTRDRYTADQLDNIKYLKTLS